MLFYLNQKTFFVKSYNMLDAGLYIVATPIGNLRDISPRAIDVLSEADIIAAEDTRVSKKLFSLLGIPTNKTFITYEDHSEQDKYQYIINLILEGKSIALISDAGSPLISDPGYKLVKECRKLDLKVTTLPGPCAVICALQLSGLPTNRFMFAGFIPNKDKAMLDLFNELKNINSTLVLYETALRIEKTLNVLAEVMPLREIAVIREISKIYEECIQGTVVEVIQQISAMPIKGEIVLVIAPPADTESELSTLDIDALLVEEMKHFSLKEAVKNISQKYNLKRNDVYEKDTAFVPAFDKRNVLCVEPRVANSPSRRGCADFYRYSAARLPAALQFYIQQRGGARRSRSRYRRQRYVALAKVHSLVRRHRKRSRCKPLRRL